MAGFEIKVQLGNCTVGTLRPNYDNPFGLAFTYDQDWLLCGGLPLTPAIPRAPDRASPDAAAFFRNLLPEGDAFECLAKFARVSKRNTLGLLIALPDDLPGAVRLRFSGRPGEAEHFRPIETEEIAMRLEDPHAPSLEIWDGRWRLSLAGAQPKLGVLKLDGVWGFAEGGRLGSDRILKFDRPGIDHLVINEYLTMQLARLAGMPAAEARLCRIAGHPVLEVLRFDRRTDKASGTLVVRRRHVIDGCQALGFFPSMKYQRDFADRLLGEHIIEGVSLRKLFGLRRHAAHHRSEAFCLRILDWAIFSLVAGNYDAHGKNISFLVTDQGLEPAPWYDLINVRMVPGVSHELAMSLGGEFDTGKVQTKHLLEEAGSAGISREAVKARLTALLASLETVLPQIAGLSELSPEERAFADAWEADIRERLARWKEVSALLTNASC